MVVNRCTYVRRGAGSVTINGNKFKSPFSQEPVVCCTWHCDVIALNCTGDPAMLILSHFRQVCASHKKMKRNEFNSSWNLYSVERSANNKIGDGLIRVNIVFLGGILVKNEQIKLWKSQLNWYFRNELKCAKWSLYPFHFHASTAKQEERTNRWPVDGKTMPDAHAGDELRAWVVPINCYTVDFLWRNLNWITYQLEMRVCARESRTHRLRM